MEQLSFVNKELYTLQFLCLSFLAIWDDKKVQLTLGFTVQGFSCYQSVFWFLVEGVY